MDWCALTAASAAAAYDRGLLAIVNMQIAVTATKLSQAVKPKWLRTPDFGLRASGASVIEPRIKVDDSWPPRCVSSRQLAVVLVDGCTSRRSATPPRDRAADFEWFETKVRPILVDHCYTCHSADTKPAGGLRVDDRNGLLAGGNSGAAVVPGDPAASLLLKRVSHKNPKSADAQGGPTSDG